MKRIYIEIAAGIKDVQQKAKTLSKTVSNLTHQIKKDFSEAVKAGESFKLKCSEIDNLLKNLLSTALLWKGAHFFEDTINEAERMENSLRGLAAVARYAGEDIGKSLDAATQLAEDGLLDVQAAAQALQNLLQRGFSLEKSIKLIERLKDAAAFNRQSHLSLAEAVVTATEGLKNENSVLVDNAGVTKNVSIMWKEYAQQIGKSVSELTLAEKRQAEFNGIMKETEAQMGNAKLAAQGLTGVKARLRVEVIKLKTAIGETLIPAFVTLAKWANWTMNNVIKPMIGGLEIVFARMAMWAMKAEVKVSMWAMKLRTIWDWIKSGFKGGFSEIKRQFDLLNKETERQFAIFDKTFEEQAKKIIEKWENKIKIPKLGPDTGKRRTEPTIPAGDTAQQKKTLSTGLKLYQEHVQKLYQTRLWLRDRLDQLTLSEFDYRRKKLLEEYEERAKVIGWTEELYKALQLDLKKIDEEEAKKLKKTEEAAQSLWESFKDGMRETLKEWKDTFNMMKDLGMEVIYALKDAVSETLYKAITGRFKDLKKVFLDFVDTVLKAITDMVAKILVIRTLSGLGLSIAGTAHQGGLVLHSGGYVVPKFHWGGLASDEVPAILQKGEYVISRRGVEILDKINQGKVRMAAAEQHVTINISAVDAESFISLVRKNPGAILEPVLAALKKNSSLRSEMLEVL